MRAEVLKLVLIASLKDIYCLLRNSHMICLLSKCAMLDFGITDNSRADCTIFSRIEGYTQ